MSKAKRLFWLVTLASFAGGCSSYGPVSRLSVGSNPEAAAGWRTAVCVGDEVSITLTDHGKVEGRILTLSAEAITLDGIRTTDYTKHPENLSGDYAPRMIAVDSILVLERSSPSAGKTSLLVGGILVGAAALLGAVIWATGGLSLGPY